MLGIYEKRHFSDGEKVWFGRYRNLTNLLHWHFECELIRIVEGRAKIKIGEAYFEANKDDCFFCSGGEVHYIIGEPDVQVEIAIFDEGLINDITDKYILYSPKLPKEIPVKENLRVIKKELEAKGRFYGEVIENLSRGLIIDIFRNCKIVKREEKLSFQQNLITKINSEFSFITFDEAVKYSGYSPSHFSKMFKKLCGMNFSQYLNIIRVENAIMMLRSDKNENITTISTKSGFSTVRNFNRVFKQITGYSPLSLPNDFVIDTGLCIFKTEDFDPTDETSILI